MRCDLHVHTVHSGMCTVPIARRFCRESYNQPLEVYEKLKLAGMDLVTITDHDSIDACEELRHFPDFFLSVEASCRMPSGSEVHVGIYDISERDHLQTQRRRADFESLLAYLREHDLFFSINHMFSGLTGHRHMSDYEWFERVFPAFETRNGAMLECANRRAAKLAGSLSKATVGGSDAHTLRGVGGTYTDVAGAVTKSEYLRGLRRGQGKVAGESGSYVKLTGDVISICAAMLRERPWTWLLSPLIAGVPGVILVNYVLETAFAEHWFQRANRQSLGRVKQLAAQIEGRVA